MSPSELPEPVAAPRADVKARKEICSLSRGIGLPIAKQLHLTLLNRLGYLEATEKVQPKQQNNLTTYSI